MFKTERERSQNETVCVIERQNVWTEIERQQETQIVRERERERERE